MAALNWEKVRRERVERREKLDAPIRRHKLRRQFGDLPAILQVTFLQAFERHALNTPFRDRVESLQRDALKYGKLSSAQLSYLGYLAGVVRYEGEVPVPIPAKQYWLERRAEEISARRNFEDAK